MTYPSIRRRSVLSAIAGAPLLNWSVARAARTTLRLGVSVGTDYSAVFAAKENGYFDKQGIHCEIIPMLNLPAITAGIVAGSLEVGTIGVTHAILSYSAGLPIAAIAPCSVTPTQQRLGLVARAEAGIARPRDIEGKRVGVPALRNNLDILASNLVRLDGGDYRKVKFIEVPIPQVPDLLAAKQIDAAVAVDPIYGRALAMGALEIGRVFDPAPPMTPVTLYSVSQSWAAAHPGMVRGFRAALQEGIDFVKAQPQTAFELVARYYKMPLEVAKSLGMPGFSSTISPVALQWIVGVMREQKLLRADPDLSAFILK